MTTDEVFKYQKFDEFIRKLDERIYTLERYLIVLGEKIDQLSKVYEDINIKVNNIDIQKAIYDAIKIK